MKRFWVRLEENSVLTNIMIYSGILMIMSALGSMGPWTVVAAVICATSFALDLTMCSIRIRKELGAEDQAAKELVSGVYRIAKDHHVTQNGNRVIVYHTEEDL